MSNWKLGQYVRVWRNDKGYVYGHIETMENSRVLLFTQPGTPVFGDVENPEVMLVGDDGKEIYTTVKDLGEGE